MEEKELAYIAGFFDGEGCITTNKQYILINASNAYREPLEFIEKVFGGYVSEYQPKNKRYKKSYRWIAQGKSALIVLEFLLPYLIVKKERAVLAIESALTSSIERKAEICVELMRLNH